MSFSLPASIPVNPRPNGAASADDAPVVTKEKQGLGGLSIKIDDDGGVTIETPKQPKPKAAADDDFYANLADDIGDGACGVIASEILDGIDADLQSRAKFISNLTRAMELLGLEIEDSTNTKSQKRNISRVHHTVLLEAVVKAQSLARGEMLPTDGPCKVKARGSTSTGEEDQLANALEADMNNYLTSIAREYYPDMDRGLFGLFFSGNLFRKIYHHPVKRRPVVDTILVEDLIVSEDATDLDSAIRVTHRSRMTPSLLKRMMLSGAWRDLPLGPAMPGNDPAKKKEGQIAGITALSMRPQDTPHEVYETTVDLDLDEWGWTEKGKPEGLPIPYVVVIEKDSREVLSITRGWRKGDTEFQRKQRFVQYGMVPGFGFLCLGYAHLLGNQTKALTAIWRILVDAGIFSNFPGGVKTKGVRTSTNEILPGPGEFAEVDTGGVDDIRKAIMPMPYKDPSPVFVQLAEAIGQDAQRLAGAAEIETGEGRTNVPVGTILAQIEQQTQVMSAVHKRLHTAQARELELLKECFAENPESLWKLAGDPKRHWQEAAEFDALDVVPVSDPNSPSNMHRIMMNMAIITMAGQHPDIYDQYAAHKRAWQQVGVGDSDTFLHPPAPGQAAPDPKAIAAQAALQAKQLDLQGKQMDLQSKQAQSQADLQERQTDAAADQQETQRKAANDQVEAQTRDREMQADYAAQQAQIQSQEAIEAMRMRTEMMKAHLQEHAAARSDATEGLGIAADHHAKLVGLGVQRETADKAAKAATAKAKATARKPAAKPAGKAKKT